MPARVPARRARLAPVEGVWCCVDDDVSAIRPPAPGYVYDVIVRVHGTKLRCTVQPVRM